MQETPLGGLSPQAFLRRHWQKRPLLVRRALADFRGVVGRRALFALAGRDDVEARLVRGSGKRWSVEHGPLPGAMLERMRAAGERRWTLLVNGVNHHAPDAERLLRRFAFIPQARLDDVMVSYAAPGGGVGPHVDSYDVFLVQGAGRRLWRIAPPRAYAMLPDAPLRVIADFRPQREFVLEAGDLLYLPPGWGHDGVALEECFTCSVGFRAPEGAELAAAFLDYLHERGLPGARYRDPGLRAARHPARIGDDMTRFAARALARISWTRADVGDFLGRHLSAPKAHVVFRAGRGSPRLAGREAVLDARTQLLYDRDRFYLNGESFRPRAAQRAALRTLADARRVPAARLVRAGLAARLRDWYRCGYLHLEKPG